MPALEADALVASPPAASQSGAPETPPCQTKKSTLSRWFAVASNLGAAAVLAVVLAVLFVRPRDSRFLAEPATGIIVTLLVLALVCALARWSPPVLVRSNRTLGLLALGATLLSCCAGFFAEFLPTWDPIILRRAATESLATGNLLPSSVNYFAMYPNNLVMLALHIVVLRCSAALHVPPICLTLTVNGVAFFVTSVASALTLRRLGRDRLVLPMFGALTLLIGLSSHMPLLYTDLLGLAACAVIVHLGVLAWEVDRRRGMVALWMIAALTGMVYLIKPYVILVPLTGLVVWVLSG